jgi:phage terminase small subunit
LVVPNAANLTEKEILQYIIQKQSGIKEKDELNNVKVIRVVHDDFPKELVAYESAEIYTQYKFGVLYVADGQTTEQEMFSNGTTRKPLFPFPQNKYFF